MDRLIWSQEAATDLEQIVQFISRDSTQYAALMAQQIVEATQDIARFPHAGRRVPEFPATDLRQVADWQLSDHLPP